MREYGRGADLKDGCGREGKLQLMLMYTGLLCEIAVEIARSISSCASSKLWITTCCSKNSLPDCQCMIRVVCKAKHMKPWM